ncbi:fumarylacetoacetate hydrolase family protein [Mycolicibacterium sp. J2]|uniref:fumarylacetoacetate hydrolase family protein n=1 Tax=Mycolicibacterium sp. J2 TaxID=2993511 RepID=UPI00224B5C60|nr:fumarylacetoacetate hydrolase family protein [Mycolicibacterium sp. J2]MCX2714029.1 fumarylacetoacetate hydrolase family protein [Mycolicibacterium sp. J2]
MLLGRFAPLGAQFSDVRLGALIDPGHLLDVTNALGKFASPAEPMTALVGAGEPAMDAVRSTVRTPAMADVHSLEEVQLLAPLSPCRMRNFSVYDGHIRNAFRAAVELRAGSVAGRVFAAANLVPPRRWYRRPTYYKGNHLSVIGPHDDIVAPSFTQQLDYELELAVVIGKSGSNIAPSDADDHIFGYALLNDVSARDLMAAELLSGMGPAKSKDFDTGNVLGPWIATADEIDNPRALRGSVNVNGEPQSQCTTFDMYHGVDAILAEASRGETLMPGEVIGTGCCTGGSGIEHKTFLQVGDVVEMTLGPLGTQRNRIVG